MEKAFCASDLAPRPDSPPCSRRSRHPLRLTHSAGQCGRTARPLWPSTDLLRPGTDLLRHSRLLPRHADGDLVVLGEAFLIAVAETCRQLTEIALPDRFAAQRTEGWRVERPAIHQDEDHMPPPREKQNTVSGGW